MAPLLFLGGMLNRMFLGVPYYLWVIVFLVILGAIFFAIWFFFFWLKLKPYHGLFWAHFRKTGASWVFDENMHFDLITERSSKVIFAETFEQAQAAERRKTEAPAATMGAVRADFVFDPKRWTYPDSLQHRIVEDIAEKWNLQHPEDQVRLLPTFMEYVALGRFDDEMYRADLEQLELTMLVPWSRIKMMYRDREESGTFGFVMTLAKTIEDIEQDSLNKYALLILGVFLLVDLLVIGGHYFH